MKFWIGVTENKWFEFLSARSPDEVNFWRPSGFGSFQAVPTDSLFLFKLHSPHNFIAGGGFFSSILTCLFRWPGKRLEKKTEQLL